MANNGAMENTIDTLERVHRDLVERLEGGDVALEAIVESVPQLVGLVERYVPRTDAVILSREQLRDLVTAVVVEVLETQANRRANLPQSANPPA